MACLNSNRDAYKNINTVRVLAQRVADLLSSDQKIYKTTCNGVEIFKFSASWKGEVVELVRHNRKDSSEDILRSYENRVVTTAKPRKPKITSEPGPEGNLD